MPELTMKLAWRLAQEDEATKSALPWCSAWGGRVALHSLVWLPMDVVEVATASVKAMKNHRWGKF